MNTVVSVDRVIEAPAGAIFAVVADASRHREVDGSGTKVTETWDISRDRQRVFLQLGKVGQRAAEAMSTTLERLAEITEPGP